MDIDIVMSWPYFAKLNLRSESKCTCLTYICGYLRTKTDLENTYVLLNKADKFLL